MNVKVSLNDGIARVVIDNHPLNLLSNKVKEEIKKVFMCLGKNKCVRVILFETAGDHFCCGADLKEFPERIKNNQAKEAWIQGHDMLNAIMEIPQPTIACVKGNALGGGAELVSAFDIRLFADNVTFGYPEVSRAVYPGNGGFERFMEIAGSSHAAYLFLTGEKIKAEESLRLGIANKIVDLHDLHQEGERIATLLSSYSNVTLQTIKKALTVYQDKDQFFEAGMKWFSLLHETEDVLESVNAFLEKRKPRYQHK